VYRSRPSPDYGCPVSPQYASYDRSRSPVRDRYRRSVQRSRSPPARRSAYD
jgi:arginine/serine-rich splicing factor 4/5/6